MLQLQGYAFIFQVCFDEMLCPRVNAQLCASSLCLADPFITQFGLKIDSMFFNHSSFCSRGSYCLFSLTLPSRPGYQVFQKPSAIIQNESFILFVQQSFFQKFLSFLIGFDSFTELSISFIPLFPVTVPCQLKPEIFFS